MYVKATNDTVDQYPYTVGDLRRDNKDVSFPKNVPESLMAEYGMFPVADQAQPQYNPATQYVETANEPTLIDGVWTLSKTVVDMTQPQIDARNDGLKGGNKRKASQLLTETDWVELDDVSNLANPPYLTNKADFTTYRAALRSIAVNPPITVESWPVKPEENWSTT